MIKIRKSGVWTAVTTYKRRTGGVWTDVQLGKRLESGTTWTIYYERLLITRPPEGNYSSMGVIQFVPNGDVKVGGRYHDAVTQIIGRWRLSGVTPSGADVIQIKVEKYLDQGDLEPGYNSPMDVWLPLYPGSYTYTYSSNNGGAGKAVMKITLKDQLERTLVFYAEIVYSGTGKIDYEPIDWSSGGGGGGGGTDPGDPPEEPVEPF